MECCVTDQEVLNEESDVGGIAAVRFLPDCPSLVPGVRSVQGSVQWPGIWAIHLRVPVR